jgi:hypothetical protein
MVAPIAMPATDSPFIAEIDDHQDHGADGEPALHPPEPDMEHVVEIVGDAGFRTARSP